MVKVGLIVLGFIILLGTFFVTQIYITPQQKQQIKMADELCNFEYMSIPLGSLAQSLSPEAAEQCEQIRYAKMIIDYSPFAYILGFVLVVIGLATGIKTYTEKEIQNISTKINESIKPQKSYDRYCEKCGSGLNQGDKFCQGCGTKLKIDKKKVDSNHCKNCGEKLTKDDKFCPSCGASKEKIEKALQSGEDYKKPSREKVLERMRKAGLSTRI